LQARARVEESGGGQKLKVGKSGGRVSAHGARLHVNEHTTARTNALELWEQTEKCKGYPTHLIGLIGFRVRRTGFEKALLSFGPVSTTAVIISNVRVAAISFSGHENRNSRAWKRNNAQQSRYSSQLL
jgi:hypothetical protein